ncbi:MAG: abortive infection system antitoxin AbiGi family protein [Acidobacteriota bacterium]
MSEKPLKSPGTVSRILWHFTGGPKWNARKKKQFKKLKPANEAYANLKKILQDRKLILGQHVEVVKLDKLDLKKNEITGNYEIGPVPAELISSKVCCISDIPIVHLGYHAERYGKFAIGFHRHAVLKNGFNPVFYTLEDTGVIRSISRGFTRLRSVDISVIRSLAADNDPGEDIDFEALQIGEYIRSAEESFKHFLAFIKTFKPQDFGTIYCEREWRSLSNFGFTYADSVAMIVLPKKVGTTEYFNEFVE